MVNVSALMFNAEELDIMLILPLNPVSHDLKLVKTVNFQQQVAGHVGVSLLIMF